MGLGMTLKGHALGHTFKFWIIYKYVIIKTKFAFVPPEVISVTPLVGKAYFGKQDSLYIPAPRVSLQQFRLNKFIAFGSLLL